MKLAQLLSLVGDEPVFETALLLAGPVSPAAIQRQLSRWVASGILHQLRRGLYALAPPYRKVCAPGFLVANRLAPGSYVSLQSALSFYDLIPEAVPVCTSVGTGRPESLSTPVGDFEFRHVRKDLLFGYRAIAMGAPEPALVALPEKALLDLVYLTPGGDEDGYLAGLRLQNLDKLDPIRLGRLAERFDKPKVARAAQAFIRMVADEVSEELEL